MSPFLSSAPDTKHQGYRAWKRDHDPKWLPHLGRSPTLHQNSLPGGSSSCPHLSSEILPSCSWQAGRNWKDTRHKSACAVLDKVVQAQSCLCPVHLGKSLTLPGPSSKTKSLQQSKHWGCRSGAGMLCQNLQVWWYVQFKSQPGIYDRPCPRSSPRTRGWLPDASALPSVLCPSPTSASASVPIGTREVYTTDPSASGPELHMLSHHKGLLGSQVAVPKATQWQSGSHTKLMRHPMPPLQPALSPMWADSRGMPTGCHWLSLVISFSHWPVSLLEPLLPLSVSSSSLWPHLMWHQELY